MLLCSAVCITALMMCTSCGGSVTESTDSSINFMQSSDAVKVYLDGENIRTDGDGIETSGSNVIVKKAGVYIFEGTLEGGRISVDAGKESTVELILNGVTVTSADGPAVYVKEADEVYVTPADGTNNILTDSETYTEENEEAGLDAALFSREDMTIRGSGSLSIKGNYKHGIVSKDSLSIESGTLEINAVKCAIEGKDSVRLAGADITVNSGSDGIRSTDTENSEHGSIYITGGFINITAGNDGIQAVNNVYVENSEITVISGGGSEAAPDKAESDMFGGKFGFKNTDSTTSDNGGTISGKGIKADGEINFTGGTLIIDSYDDALHSGGNIMVSGGETTITAGDDGLHADGEVLITGGKVSVLKSYEGIEGTKVEISGGEIHVVSEDDGINGASSDDSINQTSPNNLGGEIVISGGMIYVNASGDGVDSNGTLVVSGGALFISGSSDSANSAIDYESSAEITGGIVCALGSRGMAQNFTSAAGQSVFLTTFETQDGGVPFAVSDSDGNVIVMFTPEKSYDSALVSAPSIKAEKTYTLTTGGNFSDANEFGTALGGTFSGASVLSTVEVNADIVSNGFGGIHGMSGRKAPDIPNGETPNMQNGDMPYFPNGEIPGFPDLPNDDSRQPFMRDEPMPELKS